MLSRGLCFSLTCLQKGSLEGTLGQNSLFLYYSGLILTKLQFQKDEDKRSSYGIFANKEVELSAPGCQQSRENRVRRQAVGQIREGRRRLTPVVFQSVTMWSDGCLLNIRDSSLLLKHLSR